MILFLLSLKNASLDLEQVQGFHALSEPGEQTYFLIL